MPSSATVAPVLDLHGLTRERAIRSLVEFLEQQQQRQQQQPPYPPTATSSSSSLSSSFQQRLPAVRVITGTGAHSPQGPVLKVAVEKFLRRHAFGFTYQQGCFTVPNVHSGTLTYGTINTPPECTKVVLVGNNSDSDNNNSSGATAHRRNNSSVHRHLDMTAAPYLGDLGTGPTVAEVAHEEQELARGKQESLEHYRQRRKEHHAKESADYHVALQQSKALHVPPENPEWQQHLKQALRLSKTEEEELSSSLRQAEADELRLLQQALAQSCAASVAPPPSNSDGDTTAEEDDTALLQQVLDLSVHTARHDDDDDDVVLQRALALSAAEVTTPPPPLPQGDTTVAENLTPDNENDDDLHLLPAMHNTEHDREVGIP